MTQRDLVKTEIAEVATMASNKRAHGDEEDPAVSNPAKKSRSRPQTNAASSSNYSSETTPELTGEGQIVTSVVVSDDFEGDGQDGQIANSRSMSITGAAPNCKPEAVAKKGKGRAKKPKKPLAPKPVYGLRDLTDPMGPGEFPRSSRGDVHIHIHPIDKRYHYQLDSLTLSRHSELFRDMLSDDIEEPMAKSTLAKERALMNKFHDCARFELTFSIVVPVNNAQEPIVPGKKGPSRKVLQYDGPADSQVFAAVSMEPAIEWRTIASESCEVDYTGARNMLSHMSPDGSEANIVPVEQPMNETLCAATAFDRCGSNPNFMLADVSGGGASNTTTASISDRDDSEPTEPTMNNFALTEGKCVGETYVKTDLLKISGAPPIEGTAITVSDTRLSELPEPSIAVIGPSKDNCIIENSSRTDFSKLSEANALESTTAGDFDRHHSEPPESSLPDVVPSKDNETERTLSKEDFKKVSEAAEFSEGTVVKFVHGHHSRSARLCKNDFELNEGGVTTAKPDVSLPLMNIKECPSDDDFVEISHAPIKKPTIPKAPRPTRYGPPIVLCEAYNNLFLIYYGLKPNLFGKDINVTLTRCEALLTVASLLGSLPVARPAVCFVFLNYASRDLNLAIMADPPRWLQLAERLQSVQYFTEAMVHIVGNYPYWPWPIAFEALPGHLRGLITYKCGELWDMKTAVNERLFMVNIVDDEGRRAHLDRRNASENETFMVVSLWRDWLVHNMETFREIRTFGTLYRTIGKGGDAYLALDSVLSLFTQFRPAGFDDWKDVNQDLVLMKDAAKRVVNKLCINRSNLDVDQSGIEYLTCIEIRHSDLPWIDRLGNNADKD